MLATALGAATGRFVLPHGVTAPEKPPAVDRSASGVATPTAPTRPPSASSTGHARTPPDERDLLSVAAFRRAGVRVTRYPQNGNTGPGFAATECTGKRTVGAQTLGDITGHDPRLYGLWEEPASSATADEAIAMAESVSQARTATTRLLAAQTTCQHEPVGHWVYGRIHRWQRHDDVRAAWLGRFPAEANTTGQAPGDAEPCGGVAVLRNGQRFGVLEVYMCTDSAQLATLATAAADRLG